ncbi:hypothetical protein [Kitasatospora sp. NPDC050463]|uniref:hypothetical protein n=1 Tax=Kitasatospora sp. NPDC050463 TaxID=3155786 RepID=UPI0033D1E23B
MQGGKTSGLQDDLYVVHFSHASAVGKFTYSGRTELHDRRQELLAAETHIEVPPSEKTLVGFASVPGSASDAEAQTSQMKAELDRAVAELLDRARLVGPSRGGFGRTTCAASSAASSMPCPPRL